MAGRRPKPTALKKLAGNPGKRPLSHDEPRPDPASGHAPHGMSREALKLWQRLAPLVIELGVLSEIDVPAFILMAEHYSIATQAARMIARDGLVATDENDALRKHPLLQVLRDNATAFRMYAAEFGLTPSSRTRLKVAPLGKQLSLADELFGMLAHDGEADVDAGADGD